MAITLAHSNPVAISHGTLSVDRKFHLGMLRYASRLQERVVAINPVCRPDQRIMDRIELQLRDLPYDVLPIETGEDGLPVAQALPQLQAQITRSALVYGGDLGVAALCRASKVPYILILEYDLPTQIAATTLQIRGRMRRWLRTARCSWRYLTERIPEMRAAHALHCNGFPVYESARRHNPQCLLYFDSRMAREMLICPAQLQARLSENQHRPLRLLFSGRYEPFKGALDVLRVGIDCIERGLDIELHCYGQGSLLESMRQLAATHAGRLHVHDAIPYPQLVQLSRSFDAFVCCHVQNDPSCTYLEALGAGLPVLGYDNAMWRSMCRVSGAGLCSEMGDPAGVASGIEQLYRDRALLSDLSTNALCFATSHLFEAEFDKRIDALRSAALQCAPRPALAGA